MNKIYLNINIFGGVIMSVEEEKMTLAKEVIKEFDEMEKKRRDNQYNDVLNSFRRNIKDGTGFALFYHAVLYDDVRQRLEKDGFNVSVITSSSSGRAAYYITRNNDYALEKSRIGYEERK